MSGGAAVALSLGVQGEVMPTGATHPRSPGQVVSDEIFRFSPHSKALPLSLA